MIHLDTNAAVAAMRVDPPSVRARLDAAIEAGATLAISSVVMHELLYGAVLSLRPEVNVERVSLLLSGARAQVTPFELEDARHAADIRVELKRLGRPIGHYDLLIAAQARRHRATLVTANRREFDRVPGLTVVDWST